MKLKPVPESSCVTFPGLNLKISEGAAGVTTGIGLNTLPAEKFVCPKEQLKTQKSE